jgi:hypothetical protein
MLMFPKSRAGAVRLAAPLMILSFLAMAGFLYWLSTYTPPEDTDVVTGEDGSTLNEVPFAEFAMDTQGYMGQTITVRSVDVTSMIGTRFFWTQLPDNVPYLVHLTEEALADSVVVASGLRMDVTGSVMALSDSLLDVWHESGAFPNPNDRFQVEFALDKGDYFEVAGFETGMDGGESGDSNESAEDDPSASNDPSS